MGVHAHAAPLQAVLELLGGLLPVEARDDHGPNGDVPPAQVVDHLQRVGVVGDAEVPPDSPPLDVPRVDAQDDVGLVRQVGQEAHLHVRVIAGQHPRGVVVEDQLAAELQVELAAEALHALEDLGVLFAEGTSRCRTRSLPFPPSLLNAGEYIRCAGICQHPGAGFSGNRRSKRVYYKEVNAQSIAPLLLAAVTCYAGAYNLIIYARRPRGREYLTLAAACLFFCLYDISCALLYSAPTSQAGAQWQRWQGVGLALATASFSWFVYDYLKETVRFPARTKRVITGIFVFFLLLAGLMIVERSGLFWNPDMPLVKTFSLPFGIRIVYHEVAPGPLSNLQSIVGFLVYGYLSGLTIRAWRAGGRSLARPLLVVMCLFFIAMVSDTFVSLGWFHFIYLIEYAYMMLVIHFTYSLTTKVVQIGAAMEALRESDARFRGLVEDLERLDLGDRCKGDLHVFKPQSA